MTRPDPTFRRRDVLYGGLALSSIPLAGCTGNDDQPFGDGLGGTGSPSTDPGGDGDGDGDGDSGGDGGQTEGEIGQPLSGEYASLTVEYVRPVEEVLDYSEFPEVDADEPYGVPVDAEDMAEKGFVRSGAEFYGIGIAVKNTSDRLLNVDTVTLQTDDDLADWVFLGRNQRLTFARGNLLPGELARTEVVAGVHADPSEYTLLFMPLQNGTGRSERLRVDLGAGSNGQAEYGQEPPVDDHGTSVDVGNFDVTIHSTAFVDQVADTYRPEKYGPRPGYRYLLIDLSATRTSDVIHTSGTWRVGVRSTDGYGFAWGGIMLHDVLEANRTRVDQLAVDETIEHTTLALPVEDGFDPEFLTMDAPGPLEDPPAGGSEVGMARAVWPIE